MNQYVLVYRGEPKFKDPAEGKKHMARWMAWVASVGKAMVNPGVPFGITKIVSSRGVSKATADRATSNDRPSAAASSAPVA